MLYSVLSASLLCRDRPAHLTHAVTIAHNNGTRGQLFSLWFQELFNCTHCLAYRRIEDVLSHAFGVLKICCREDTTVMQPCGAPHAHLLRSATFRNHHLNNSMLHGMLTKLSNMTDRSSILSSQVETKCEVLNTSVQWAQLFCPNPWISACLACDLCPCLRTRDEILCEPLLRLIDPT